MISFPSTQNNNKSSYGTYFYHHTNNNSNHSHDNNNNKGSKRSSSISGSSIGSRNNGNINIVVNDDKDDDDVNDVHGFVPPLNIYRLVLVLSIGFLSIFTIFIEYHNRNDNIDTSNVDINEISSLLISSSSSPTSSFLLSLLLNVNINDDAYYDDIVVSDIITLRRVGYDIISLYAWDKSEYIQYQPTLAYHAIIEPYAPMILAIKNINSDNGNDDGSQQSNYIDIDSLGVDLHYRVCGVMDDNIDACVEGKIETSDNDNDDDNDDYFDVNDDGASTKYITVPCRPYDNFNISIHVIDPITSAKLSTIRLHALCIYVRREIESLTKNDLAETMDAMYALWEYSEKEGQSLFGDQFHSALYFSEMHFFSAAQKDSDHIHEGLGFLAQHIKICKVFEEAMQAVNPKVTLPYWEYTKELPRNITLFDSYMFTADTFGSLAVPYDKSRGFTYENDRIEDGMIPDGRWAELSANVNTRFPTIVSSFGYIRSPWNINPSPYITRFVANMPPLPTCADYYGALISDDPTDLLSNIQKGPHASIHAAIGNVFGCDLLDPLLEAGLLQDELARTNLCRQWSYFMKDLFRDQYLLPKTGCSVAASGNLNDFVCGYECIPDTMDELLAALQTMLNMGYAPRNGLTKDQWLQWRDFVCTGNGYRIIVGAHMDSTSASDPSFWPAHPTQERLWQAKMMSIKYLGEFDWPGNPRNNYVCDTSSCFSEQAGTKDYHEVCCYGHKKEDQWLDFVNADRYSFIGPTNIETILATNPNSAEYSMPYVYDSFDYSHCKQGVDDLLLSTFINGVSDENDDKSTHSVVIKGPGH